MAAIIRCFVVCLVFCLIYSVNSQSNTTDPPITTTTEPITTTTPSAPTEATPVERNTDLGNCTCDLTANGCDVNCCCDQECTDDDRLAFSSCDDEYNIVDTQSCVRSDLIFRENTPYVVNNTVPGIFCVQFDNYASRNYFEAPEIINSTEKFDEFRNQYGPGYSFQQPSTDQNINYDFYKSGDPIYTVYENEALGMLGLPAPLFSRLCADSNPAAFLYSQTLECIRTISDLATECASSPALNALNYYDGIRFVTTPAVFKPENSTNETLSTTQSPVNGTLTEEEGLSLFNSTFAVDIMPDGPHTCIDSSGVNTTCDFTSNLPVPSYAGNTCNNAVVKVQYTIYHNGTDGIASVSVAFTFRNFTDALIPLTQGFETVFMKEGDNATFMRSGNPGYQAEQPLLAGNLVESLADDGTIVYAIEMDSNRDNWITMVTSSANGECASEPDNRISVTFDLAMRSGCFITVYFSNMSEACTVIQQAAWNALRGPNPAEYVATFGNTPVEKVGDWVQIFGVNDEPPTPTSSQTPGVCRNIITGLHMEFIYADVGSLANPQPKILGASYQYHTQDELRFQCIGPYCQPGNEGSQRIEIVSSVGFIDASRKAIPVSGEKPRVSARLPEDFFYPFS